MVTRKIQRLMESSLSAEEIVKRLTESTQEEEVQKPVRESRRRRVEEANEDDDYNEQEDGY